MPYSLAGRQGALILFVTALLFLVVGLYFIHTLAPETALLVGFSGLVILLSIVSDEAALYLLIFSMLLGPQFLLGELGSEGAAARGLTLRLDDFILLVISLTWLAKSAINKELGIFPKTPLNRPMLYFSLVNVISTGIGMFVGRVDPAPGSLFVLKYIQYFVIYFMVINNLRTEKQFRRYLFVLLATAFLASLFGIAQIPSGERVSAPFEESATGSRVGASEPNTFGGYLVLMLALTFGLVLTAESLDAKAGFCVLALIMGLPFLFTLSRASYVAAIPMALGLLFLSNKRWTVLITMVVLTLFAPIVTPHAVIERILYTFSQYPGPGQQILFGGQLDPSTTVRLKAWKTVLFTAWPTHPLLGFGVTGWYLIDAQYARVLVETGIFGLLAFLWLQFQLFRQSLTIYRQARSPLSKGTALGFLAGMLGLLTHAIGANTFIIVRIMEPFWLLAGMVMTIPAVEVRAQETETAQRQTGLPAIGLAPGRLKLKGDIR